MRFLEAHGGGGRLGRGGAEAADKMSVSGSYWRERQGGLFLVKG